MVEIAFELLPFKEGVCHISVENMNRLLLLLKEAGGIITSAFQRARLALASDTYRT
jgi:hypothetical protein